MDQYQLYPSMPYWYYAILGLFGGWTCLNPDKSQLFGYSLSHQGGWAKWSVWHQMREGQHLRRFSWSHPSHWRIAWWDGWNLMESGFLDGFGSIFCMFWWSSFIHTSWKSVDFTWNQAELDCWALGFSPGLCCNVDQPLGCKRMHWNVVTATAGVTAGMVLVEMPRAGMDHIPLRFAAKDIWRVGPLKHVETHKWNPWKSLHLEASMRSTPPQKNNVPIGLRL